MIGLLMLRIYFLVAGDQENYRYLRHATAEFCKDNMQKFDAYRPNKYPTMTAALSDIKKDKVYATQLDIALVSSMLNVPIFTYTDYTLHGGWKWAQFRPVRDVKPLSSLQSDDCAIYLNHTGLIHYDVVIAL